jgi:hypothetical protein
MKGDAAGGSYWHSTRWPVPRPGTPADQQRERIGRAFPEIGGEQPAAVITVVPIVSGSEIEPPT